jgi:hypothetical protein
MARPRSTRSALGILLAILMLGCFLPAGPTVADQGDTVASEGKGEDKQVCDSVDTVGLPVKGGCTMRAVAGPNDLRFTVVTPFGVVPFSDCGQSFTVHVDSAGSVWLGFIRSDGGNPCGDVQPCLVEGMGTQRPWTGRIRVADDGEVRMRVNICLDTCMGWFEGPTDIGLRRVDGAWRLRADDALIGDSGLEVDGEWKTTNRRLRLEQLPKS